jgi:hypothetical protein
MSYRRNPVFVMLISGSSGLNMTMDEYLRLYALKVEIIFYYYSINILTTLEFDSNFETKGER